MNELVEPFAISQPAISRHLKVLEQAGLISRGRDAQRRPCRIEAVPLADVSEWLENYRRFWEARYERLDALLDELKKPLKLKKPRGRGRRQKAMPGKVGTGFPSGIASSEVRGVKPMQKITPFLWFDTQAEEAMNFYTSVFKNSKAGSVSRYGEAGPGDHGSVHDGLLRARRPQFTALNGGPHFKFNEAISMYVNCETQEEVDYYWEKLSADGGRSSSAAGSRTSSASPGRSSRRRCRG